MARHVLCGRAFLEVGESTVAHDLRFRQLVAKLDPDALTKLPDESAEDYGRRLLDALNASGQVLPILACGLVPEEAIPNGKEPGDVWTPELAEETVSYLGALRAKDAIQVLDRLTLSVLIGLFQSGIVSLKTFASSSSPGDPAPASGQETATGSGPSSSGSSAPAT